MIRLLLADDQPLLRLGYRMVLDAEPDLEVVAEAGTGREALAQVSASAPDVVLMDVRMPEMDGIAATAQITRTSPQTRVIILTTFQLDEYVFAGLRSGAAGFLLKDVEPPALIAAIRAVAQGDAALSPQVTRTMLDAVADALPDPQTEAERRRITEVLTARELEVLGLVATGLTNPEIAAQLFLSEGTVKVHIGRILAKLELRGRVQMVILAYRAGLAG
ncbi:response regulator transcription factor [Branchiibius sp. NY16-3462-2]|uniref:response regulator n=1 Tax=Branchiibius sp. NY16-3462-2 TaxID=1807500 RepID=UPI0007931255|nr:response regulator transcription factor [Branchiibius sp. NY16-3462-2]KYH43435.1 DNA-binding response regulator [Branchiibius sp. NY16-3462-2]